VFDGPNGEESLGDHFEGRNQLIVQHFMFAPDWQAGCKICSLGANRVDGAIIYLARRGFRRGFTLGKAECRHLIDLLDSETGLPSSGQIPTGPYIR
jgi:predicted dithiol-disulfide oxidoreductase (DUF899 family)